MSSKAPGRRNLRIFGTSVCSHPPVSVERSFPSKVKINGVGLRRSSQSYYIVKQEGGVSMHRGKIYACKESWREPRFCTFSFRSSPEIFDGR